MTVKIKKSTALGALNITPLIDIVFLLLIFFLVTSRFEAEEQALAIDPPQASEARIAHMAKTLSEKIGPGEAALLIISSTRGIDIPNDIEQFNIMPPELDALSRWIQETAKAQEAELQAAQARVASGEAASGEAASGAGVPTVAPQDDGEGPKLWTPGNP